MSNPLLQQHALPAFSKIKPEHVKPAVEKAIGDCKDAIEKVLSENTVYTWENLVAPIDDVDDVLGKYGHLFLT